MATDTLQNNSTGTLEPSDLSKLHRYLCYGSVDPRYDASLDHNKEVPLEDAGFIQGCVNNGLGDAVINEIRDFAATGANVRLDPILFSLAVCAKLGCGTLPSGSKLSEDRPTKQAALKAVIDVCASPVQLFRFVDYSEKLCGQSSGWGRGHKKAISEWYNKKGSVPLSQAVTRYIQRYGWSHRDLIRLAHIKAEKDAIAVCLVFVVKGLEAANKQFGSNCPSAEVSSVLKYLEAVDRVKKHLREGDELEAAKLVEQHRLTKEHIPTHFANSKEVWRALLQHMPLLDIMNNLSKLTSLGLLNSESAGNQTPLVIERLQNDTFIQESRVHPFQTLHTYTTYSRGKMDRGKLTWRPDASILDALQKNTFPATFKNVPPTLKRYLVAVDVARVNNGCRVVGSAWLSPVVAAAAMTMLVARTEQQYQLVVSSETISPADLTPSMPLSEIVTLISQPPSERKRDCARPLVWATENKKTVDVFLILTDGDTRQYSVHPRDALKTYREQLGIPDAKLVMCGLTDAKLCIADSADLGMLDVVGFDVEAPRVIHNFVSGKL